MAKCRATGGEDLPDRIKTTSRLFLIVSILSVLICLLFLRPLAGRVLGDRSMYAFLIPAILGTGFVVQTDMWQAYLQAGLEMKQYSASVVSASLAGLVVVIPLVILWGQRGAAFHLLMAAFFGYFFVRLWSNRSMGREVRARLKLARFRWEIVLGLTRFAGANLLTFFLSLGVPFFVSTQIVHDAGLGAKGIYQAVIALGCGYIMVPLNAIDQYQLARLSQLDVHSEIVDEVNSTLKLAILINTFMVICVLLVGDLLIRVLFSRKFMPALPLLPWMMIASFFRFYAFVIGAPVLPLELFKARNIICVIEYIVYLAVFFCAPAHMRLQGAVWAEAAHWLVAMVCNYVYLSRAIHLRISRGNIVVSVVSLVALVIVACMPCSRIMYRAAGFGVLALWALISIRKREFRQMLGLLTRRAA